MLTEDQIEASLRSALREETSHLRVPGGLAVRAKRRARQRTWTTRGVAAALPVTVAMAAAVVTLTHPGSAGPSGPTTSVQSMESVAYLRQHLEAALANTSRYVRRTQEVYGGRPGETQTDWQDAATGRVRSDFFTGTTLTGVQLVSGVGTTAQAETDVDHLHRTWFSTVDTMTPAEARSGRESLDMTGEIRAWIDTGQVVIDHQQLGGRDTVHLRFVDLPNKEFRLEWWVDATTYLPYRISSGTSSKSMMVSNITWLPRTPQALSHFDLTVPSGYRRLDKPIFN
jgi:hypothetical protein